MVAPPIVVLFCLCSQSLHIFAAQMRSEPGNTVSILAGGSVQVVPQEEATCLLGPGAPIVAVNDTSEGACIWQPVPGMAASQCQYSLTGTCNRKVVNGCTFYGPPGNERRIPGTAMPYGRAPGEVNLEDHEETGLLEPFRACDSRTSFWLLSRLPGFSLDRPSTIAMGGSSIIQQHVYFVEGEVSGPNDFYDLGKLSREGFSPTIMVDIGANIGLYSISACKRFPHATIYAFEPHPMNYRFLVNNLKSAGCADRVKTFNTGVTTDGRILEFYFIESIRSTAYDFLKKFQGAAGVQPTKLPSISIKDLWGPKYLGTNTVVDMMKVDCEGCEYEIVPGLQRSLVHKMKCETHPFDPKVLGAHGQEIMDHVKQACEEGQPL